MPKNRGNRSWDDIGKDVQAGPKSLVKKVIIPGIVLLFGLGIGLSVVSYTLGWFAETAQVAQEEFGPRELLRKYEWFKDASAQLDKKRQDLTVFNQRQKNMTDTYRDLARHKWPRTDLEQYNLWSSESAGIAASYNGLAAEYNSQMSKFNWAFTNAGSLPIGADTVLPREYKPYLSN